MVNKRKGGATGRVNKRGRQKQSSVKLKEVLCKECWKHCDKEFEKLKKAHMKTQTDLVEKKFVITGLQAEVTTLQNEILTKDELLKKLEFQMNNENHEAETQIADLKNQLEIEQRQISESGRADLNAEITHLQLLLCAEQQKTQHLEETQSKTMNLILSARNLLCPQSQPQFQSVSL
jgi:chromosome segregation ATPase